MGKQRTSEDNIRFELIDTGYHLFPYLKIMIEPRISNRTTKGVNIEPEKETYIEVVMDLITSHDDAHNTEHIISPISNKCYEYLSTIMRKEGLL